VTPIWRFASTMHGKGLYHLFAMEFDYPPPVHMINLTATQEITLYKWVHPDEEG
jgi:hypothetical protein